ncbi:MAG: flagellin [Alphaproteobacteria bacterium]|nr:flagellin [Alphaproteobacteria bacterium]
MALTVISNFAANVAHRNLTKSDMEATRSLAQLSSGQRVVSAKDDAASMAIGSRFRAEVAALRAARVNAGQATSMLQVAEGAMGQVDGILVRMKTLAIQAASSQYGSVERGLIDTEYQQLLLEVDRIAADTEFNGAQLLDGAALSQLQTASDPNNDGVDTIKLDSSVEDDATFRYSYDATNELFSLTKMGVSNVLTNEAQELFDRSSLSFAFDGTVADDAVFTYQYAQATDTFTLTNTTTGDTATLDVTSAYQQAFGAGVTTVPAGQSLAVEFSSLGVTVTFEQGFNFAADITAPTPAATNIVNTNAISATFPTGLSDDAITALNALIGGTAGVATINATDVAPNINLAATAGFQFNVNGGTVAAAPPNNLQSAISTVGVFIDVDGDTTFETQVATITLDLGAANNDGARTISLDFTQIVSNTQTVQALNDQTVQIDITDDLDAVAGAGNNLQFDQSLELDIAQFGVALTLDKGFDRTTSVPNTIGTASASAGTTVTAASFATNTNFLTADVYQQLLNLGFNATTGVGYNATTGVLSLQVSDDNTGAGLGNVTLDGLAGISYGFGDGNPTGDLTGAGSTTTLSITMADGSLVELGTVTGTYVNTGNDGGTIGPQETIDIQLGRGVFYNQVDTSAGTTQFTFKIGTANEPSDDITLTLNAVNIAALGLTGSDLGTKETADAASLAVTDAVANLNKARANIGALQNRLDIASSNLAVSLENTEAARSQLLDLDVAQEITNFTSKQILMQAGVSMLAQANQLPQNLLRLFQ